MNRGGFSWNRLLGITRLKRNISRKTGIPLTRSGRQQKIGRIITGGCMVSLTLICFLFSLLLILAAAAV